MTPSRGREHHQTHCLLKRFDIECKTSEVDPPGAKHD